MKTRNPNVKKFGKDRSVDFNWEKLPLYYTRIINPSNKDKELVIMEVFGKHCSACWRNNALSKVGITFLLKTTGDGFIFKGKEYKFKNLNMVW